MEAGKEREGGGWFCSEKSGLQLGATDMPLGYQAGGDVSRYVLQGVHPGANESMDLGS